MQTAVSMLDSDEHVGELLEYLAPGLKAYSIANTVGGCIAMREFPGMLAALRRRRAEADASWRKRDLGRAIFCAAASEGAVPQ